MIWLALGTMLLAAVAVVARPLYRQRGRVTPALVVSAVTVLAVSALVYWRVGTPVPPESFDSIGDMVAELDRRLQENPDDVEGWRMLGTARLQLQDYPQAIAAFERVVEMESGSNALSLAQLGEALMAIGPESVERADGLFQAALALEPANPRALFFGGITAAERGALDTAAARWERLLAMSPPPEIENILRPRIAQWRGEAPPADAGAEAGSALVAVDVSLAAQAAAAVAPEATVWIIARDPQQPAPAIAAARRQVADLPARIELGDGDAMVPGRLLSAFREVDIVARVSPSGEPAAQAGDWYGEGTAATGAGEAIEVVIGQQVPADATASAQ